MLKKSEVIEALENGGMISVDSIYRTARVLDSDYNELGTCRYDTAERIERSEGYKRRKTSWFAHWFVEKDWDAVGARVMAAATEAFRAMERAGIISDLEIEPISATGCAELGAAQATEEATPAAQPPKQYARADGTEATRSASEALSWHRAGHDVIVAASGRPAVYVHGAPQKPKRSDADKNRDHCRRIAKEIDEYAGGSVRRCPECGEIHARDWDEVGDVFRCPECGEVSDVDAWDVLSVWDYLDDALDIEYRVSGRARDALRSVCVMIACGGPNIYIDTESRAVELYWWGDRASYPISHAAADEIDEWAAEIWACQ